MEGALMKCSSCGVTFVYTLKGWRKKPAILCPDCNGNPTVIKSVERYKQTRRTLEEVRRDLQETKAFHIDFYKRWGYGNHDPTPVQMGLDDLEAVELRKWDTPPGHELCGHEGCNHLVGHGRHELWGPSFRRYMCECGEFFRTRRDLVRHLKAAWKTWTKRRHNMRPMELEDPGQQVALESFVDGQVDVVEPMIVEVTTR